MRDDERFLEGMGFNQKKIEQRLTSGIHRAYTLKESNQFIKGMTMALNIIRGETYDRKMLNLDEPNYEKIKED
jgi:hypothetical protein